MVFRIKKILIVDDNEEILDIISYHLNKSGYHVLLAQDAKRALDIISEHNISVAILDVMMPNIDGFTLCRTIRKNYFFPILFLTAKECENNKLEGFECGADDYMTKPFSSKELLARIDSLIRRNTQYNLKQVTSVCQIANLEYEVQSGIIRINNILLDLTDIEYRILVLLIDQRGNSLNTEEIYSKIWGDPFTISSNNNVVVHIKNIRKKIATLDNQVEYIHTVWGKGYAIYV